MPNIPTLFVIFLSRKWGSKTLSPHDSASQQRWKEGELEVSELKGPYITPDLIAVSLS